MSANHHCIPLLAHQSHHHIIPIYIRSVQVEQTFEVMDNFGDGYDESSDIEDYSHLEPIYEKCL